MIQVLPAPVLSPPQQQTRRDTQRPRRSLALALFGWRRTYGFGLVETCVLAAYCAVLAIVIPHHEPWGDEVQAWLLAQNNSSWQILRHRLHYEGTPPIWHLILHLVSSAHGSFIAVQYLGAAFAAAAIYVLLRWSPFPLILRILLPFTFFLQYQYAVVARSYTLFALLVFSLCAFYRRRRSIGFALAAGLLANLSMQGLVVSFVFATLYAYDLFRERRFRCAPTRRLTAAALLFAGCCAVACYIAIPAPDINFAVSGSVSDGAVHRLLVRYIGELPNFYSAAPAPPPVVPPPAPEAPMPRLLASPAAWAAWHLNHRPHDANGYPGPQSSASSAAEFLVSIASQATWPVATSNLLACAFLGMLLLWLRSRESLRMLLPWLALMLFGQIVWVADHHVGLLFTILLAGIWIAAEHHPNPNPPSRLDYSFVTVFSIVAILQVVWSADCIRKDMRGAYDPGRETAKYLIAHPAQRTAAFHYWSVSMQPYFARNPFFNIPSRYWIWSWKANPDPYYQEVVAAHADRIVDSVEFPTQGQMRDQWIPLNHIPTQMDRQTLPWDYALQYFHAHGYVETHRFCGTRFARNGTSFLDCNLILDRIK